MKNKYGGRFNFMSNPLPFSTTAGMLSLCMLYHTATTSYCAVNQIPPIHDCRLFVSLLAVEKVFTELVVTLVT
jgi:hypothetical protein